MAKQRAKFIYKGGPGSGHHGHAGRPGKVGGSSGGGSGGGAYTLSAAKTQLQRVTSNNVAYYRNAVRGNDDIYMKVVNAKRGDSRYDDRDPFGTMTSQTRKLFERVVSDNALSGHVQDQAQELLDMNHSEGGVYSSEIRTFMHVLERVIEDAS